MLGSREMVAFAAPRRCDGARRRAAEDDGGERARAAAALRGGHRAVDPEAAAKGTGPAATIVAREGSRSSGHLNLFV